MQYANSSTNSMSSSSILSSTTTRNSTIYYSRPAHEDNGNSSTSKRNATEDNTNDSKTSNHDIFLGAFVFASLVLLFIGLYKCRVRFIRRNDMATTTTTSSSSSTNTRGNRSSMSSGRAFSTTSLIRNIGRGGGRGHGGDGADALQTLLFGQQERRGQEQEGGRGGRMDSFVTLSLQERRSSIQNQIQTKRLILAKSSFAEEDKSSRNKSTVICDEYIAKANDPNEGAQQHPNKGIPPVCYSTGSTCDGTSSTNTHCTYTTSSPLNSRSFNIDDFIGSECVICCMPYKEGDVVSISRNEKCSHVFHLECMLTWLCGDHDATCPSCRQDYLKDTGGLRTAASGSTSVLSSTSSATNIGFDSATPTSSSSTNTDDDDDERNTLYYDSSVDAEEQEETLFMHQVEQCNNNRSSTSMTKSILLANDYDDDDAEEFKRGAPFLLSSDDDDDDDDLSSFLQQEETDEEAPPQIPAASMATANTTTFIPVGNFVEDLQYDDDEEGGQIAL